MAYYVIRTNDVRILTAKSDLELKRGQNVIVNIDGISEWATVLYSVDTCEEDCSVIVRVATENDKETNARMLSFKESDREKVVKCVEALGLELKLVTVLRTFDGKKILIMYTADDRVDFRQLVKDLASIFRMRVEMRQISERDEAKYCGGCGMCGQELCCRRFLNIPRQTSIKMAKIQSLSLTPSRVNGACGKLMCCLQYEYSQYRDVVEKLPPIGSIVNTPDGKGTIIYLDILRELLAVKLDDENKMITKYPLEEITVLKQAERIEEKEDE